MRNLSSDISNVTLLLVNLSITMDSYKKINITEKQVICGKSGFLYHLNLPLSKLLLKFNLNLFDTIISLILKKKSSNSIFCFLFLGRDVVTQ